MTFAQYCVYTPHSGSESKNVGLYVRVMYICMPVPHHCVNSFRKRQKLDQYGNHVEEQQARAEPTWTNWKI